MYYLWLAIEVGLIVLARLQKKLLSARYDYLCEPPGNITLVVLLRNAIIKTPPFTLTLVTIFPIVYAKALTVSIVGSHRTVRLRTSPNLSTCQCGLERFRRVERPEILTIFR